MGAENGAKKRSVSTLSAAVLFPKGGKEYADAYSLLEDAYSIRNAFVHAGKAEWADNKKLFHCVFSAWLKIAHLSLEFKNEKDFLAIVKRVVPVRSKIYRDIFLKDYLETELGLSSPP